MHAEQTNGAADPVGGADAMHLVLSLEVPSDVRYIERIVDLVARQCADFHYPRRVCALNVPVALTEAIANAILRGNREAPDKKVQVRADMDATRIVLEIHDEGAGFDIDAVTRDPTASDQLEREDGRGIFLMRRLMDLVERVPHGPGTLVRLTLRRA